MDNVIINPMKYFDFKREPKWLNDEFVRKMILDIDNAKVIQDEFIMNNEGRAITPFHLPEGTELVYHHGKKLPECYLSECSGCNKSIHLFFGNWLLAGSKLEINNM